MKGPPDVPEVPVLKTGSEVPGRRLDWRIVLVRPRNPLNIGAAARAMANFGLADLVVVQPYGPAWQETRSAVGADHVIRSARSASTLLDALAGIKLVIGTTSGQRRTFSRELLNLESLSSWARERDRAAAGALLFGSEKTGLSNEDFSYCQALVRIPTVPQCPSMNLGQAVAVCCYELARGANAECHRGAPSSQSPAIAIEHTPANVECIQHVFERAVRVLDRVGYLKPKSRRATIIKLRQMLLDHRLSSYDARILGGVLAQIEWKLEQGNK
jgi:TrmH family RNA methyltransferase